MTTAVLVVAALAMAGAVGALARWSGARLGERFGASLAAATAATAKLEARLTIVEAMYQQMSRDFIAYRARTVDQLTAIQATVAELASAIETQELGEVQRLLNELRARATPRE